MITYLLSVKFSNSEINKEKIREIISDEFDSFGLSDCCWLLHTHYESSDIWQSLHKALKYDDEVSIFKINRSEFITQNQECLHWLQRTWEDYRRSRWWYYRRP